MGLFLAVELDNEIKNKLYAKQLELKRGCTSGQWEYPSSFHITVKFLGDETIHERVIDVLKTWKEKCQPKQFEVYAKDFCRFEQGVSWVGVHDSMPLYEMKHQIEETAKSVGNQFKKDDFNGYTPHITMGYDVQEKPELQRIWNEGIVVPVTNITLWGYNPKVNDQHISNFLYRINFQ